MPRNALLGAALATSTLGILAAGLQVPTAATTAPTVPAASITSPAPTTSPGEARAAAQAYLKTHRGLVNAAPGDAFTVVDTITTKQDITYVAYERSHRGLPVIGGDFVVTVDKAGEVASLASGQEQPIRLASLTPTVSRVQASATADDHAPRAGRVDSTRLVILAQGNPRLAWESRVTGVRSNGIPVDLRTRIDARTGRFIDSEDLVLAGVGTGHYNGQVNFGTTDDGQGGFVMADPDRPGQECSSRFAPPFTSQDDEWGDGTAHSPETACVDVMYGMNQMWDMLSDWFGRNGIKGDNTGYLAEVGLFNPLSFWSPAETLYGQDLQGQFTALDIVAHENGHGVFFTTPGGHSGDRETGGMNEATGDIFGALTEAYADNPHDPADFVVGEELLGSGPLRYMHDPGLRGHPRCWTPDLKMMEIHEAAGPLDHWFYLLAQGTHPTTGPISPTCNDTTITGLGIQDAGTIFYHALLQKTSFWDHAAARKAALQAALDLYGTSDCRAYNTVRKAWNAISVPAQDGEPVCDGTVCSDHTLTGTADPGSPILLPETDGFFSVPGSFRGCLRGPDHAQLRLTLQRRLKYSWVDLATASGSGQVEVFKVGTAASYRWRVEALSGSPAPYTLVYDTP